MGAAIDKPDKSKTRAKISCVFSKVVAGEIKNVYTKKDYILAFCYTPCEWDLAMGRHDCFSDQVLDDRRSNLLGDPDQFGYLDAVA